jgi:hypothetical protein
VEGCSDELDRAARSGGWPTGGRPPDARTGSKVDRRDLDRRAGRNDPRATTRERRVADRREATGQQALLADENSRIFIRQYQELPEEHTSIEEAVSHDTGQSTGA